MRLEPSPEPATLKEFPFGRTTGSPLIKPLLTCISMWQGRCLAAVRTLEMSPSYRSQQQMHLLNGFGPTYRGEPQDASSSLPVF